MLIQNNTLLRSISTCLLLFLTASGVPAFASEPGWYLGFSAGESDIVNPERVDKFCATAGIVCGDEKKDTALQAIVGYQINSYLGVEGTLFDLGNPSLSTEAPIAASAKVNIKGGSISLLPQIPLGSLGAIFARAGIAGGEVELVAEAPSIPRRESASSSGATFMWGAGGAINLGNFTVRVEWQRYAFDQTLDLAQVDIDTPDMDVYTATLLFRFPKKN